MPSPIHKNLAMGPWFSLALMEQLGNIGSEVERALRAHEQGNQERFEKAFDRALELMDLTISDPRWRTRLKELLRTREVFCDYFFGHNSYAVTSAQLRKDFLYYGIAARSGK
ncbi:hypothetical protein HY620_00505 [Candidatus Uhrbacteria bacterium]|nr:hypothetical protein [Candidatus Uhrbacteria bacterium]